MKTECNEVFRIGEWASEVYNIAIRKRIG